MLISSLDKRGKYENLPNSIVTAIRECQPKVTKYFSLMDNNIIHYIAIVLDPRLKTHPLKRFCTNSDSLVRRIKDYIKEVYKIQPSSETLIERDRDSQELSLQHRMLMVSYLLLLLIL